MTREEIKNKVVAIVADKIGFFQNEIEESTRFKADLGTDSLDDIELLIEFEHVFGIKIPDEEMMRIVTVGDVINGLAARFGVVAEEKDQKPAELRDNRQIALMIENGRRSGVIEGRKQVVDNPEEYGLCKPTEWSEEEEKDILEASRYLRDYANNCVQGGNSKLYIQNLADRIESLRPQPHWKPSEEQMEALSDAYVEASTFKKGEILESLYNDLQQKL